jgi:uncharacterized membrane protein YeaQ/YmgE (transglycosylase-associated protein family)
MGCLSWVVFGLLAGFLAKVLTPGEDKGGLILTLLLGVAGAVVGGYVATLLGYGGVSGFNLYSLLIAIGGAILLLLLYRLVRK